MKQQEAALRIPWSMVPNPLDRAKGLCDDHLGKLKNFLINLIFELVNIIYNCSN